MALRDRPACLVLTRQAVRTLDRTRYAPARGLARGAYVLADADEGPDVLLIGTGSEVGLCVDAYEQLRAEGIRARVVSMPSWELFEEQTAAYRESVLPARVAARVTVEAASPFGWERYAGPRGAILGVGTFGLSAPAKIVARHYGFDVHHVVEAAKVQLNRRPNDGSRARKKTASPA
jgi:transketolase